MSKQLCRQELYELVWSTPMKTLAARFGISDVGLKKACARAAVPTPERSYWAKREADKKTFQVALPKRAPGMNDKIVIGGGNYQLYYDTTEEEILGDLPSPPEFPEPIEAVRERILGVIGQITVPQKVKGWHPTIGNLLKDVEKRREQQLTAVYRTSWDGPRFDSPVERRRLRILNSLFFAAAKMHGRPTISGHDPQSICVSFHEQHVAIRLDQPTKPRHRGGVATKQLSTADEPKLSFSILHNRGFDACRATWRDDDGSKLEAHMTDIAVQLILTAELQYREGEIHRHEWRVKRKAELEEKERQRKIEAERAERARRQRIEQARIDRLLKDAAAFQQANAIRKYIEALRSVQTSQEVAPCEEFDRWSKWALGQADRIDPARGGALLAAMQDKEDA